MTTWLPLESNPDVLNKYIYKLGVSEKWNIVDVLGLEPEMLEWIAKPVKAVILLIPCSNAYEKHLADEVENLKENPPKISENLFFMKQVIHNACGTIALVHSIANTDVDVNDGVLKKYLEEAKSLTAEVRGKLLESNSEFTDVHQELALEGQTGAPNIDDKINHHFTAFIEKDGILYELDGRKTTPIPHGPTNEDTFLLDAAKICKKFMSLDPEEIRFTVIALTPTQN